MKFLSRYIFLWIVFAVVVVLAYIVGTARARTDSGMMYLVTCTANNTLVYEIISPIKPDNLSRYWIDIVEPSGKHIYTNHLCIIREGTEEELKSSLSR